VEVSVNAHLKGPLKPTPGSQVLGTAGVPLSITRWTRHPHGESMDAKKIVSYAYYINLLLGSLYLFKKLRLNPLGSFIHLSIHRD
jgi:hypothetical protein